jgi:hypothetical protein
VKIKGLDGQVYTLKFDTELPGYCSGLHELARSTLQEVFPCDTIAEEVILPGSGNMRFDFFLPLRRLAIEVQGEQHYSQNSKFHKNSGEFIAGKNRDKAKAQFCKINKITLLELKYNEQSDWRRQIIEWASE